MQLFKFCGKRKKLEADSREQFSQNGGEILRKSRSELLNAVQLTAATALGFQRSAVNADTRLVGLSGLDSAAAVHFVELLQKHLKIGQLPATLVFDYPTVGELVDKGLPRFLHGTADDLPLDIPQVAFSSDSDLLISSSSCSLPGAQDLQALWQRLEGGYDEVQEIPLNRWDWTEGIDGIRHGSFLKDVDQFDAEFFRLSPAETAAMDPQQRLLLTTSYSALASSGHDQATLLGSPMSVFVALSNQDWYHRSLSPSDAGTAYTGTGVSAAIGANRLSFTLGLRGSSATIDTACSSSLMAISAAAENLRQPSRHAGPSCRRKIRESVAAACELLLGPNSIALRSAAGMLSPLGRCQTFNATADGYVRGEGSGAMLLTLGDDPSWFGSEVMLCAATTNQDGRSATLTAPNGQAQEDVLLDALWRASLPAASVNFVECHGTGTALGDPIEARALRAVLGREREEKLWLGAGKSFLGHLEAAAGFAGLAKVMCSLQQGAVVPNLHFNVLNPHIDLNNSCLDVPTVVSPVSPIRSHEKGIVAGLSSFGFGGTNAHALLRRNANKSLGPEIGDSKVAMIFTGQGEMRPGVGKELYSKDATFRAAMDRCAELCTTYLDHGLLDVIFSEDSIPLMSSALYSFVATFCLQHAMVEMWTARGVQPLAVLGHSLGDFAAATAAEVMSLEEGLRLVAARGRLLDERCKDLQGLMAAIFAPLSEVQRAMVKYKDLSIAAMNSPSQTVVSGPKDVVEEFVFQHFPGKNKLLSSTYAMHSKLVAGVLEGMKEEIKTENLAVPTVTFVSCMTGSVVKEEVTTAEYWLSHDMDSKPVNFLDAVKTLENVGCSTFLEIGPSPVLAKIAQTFSQVPGRWLTTLESGREETEKILSLSRKMQVAGGTLFPSVSRQMASASASPFEPWVKPLFHPLLGKQQLPCQVFTKRLHHFSPNLTPALRLFQQHQVQGEAVLPAASHLLLMAAAYLESRSYMMSHLRDAFVLLQDVSFEQIFPLSELQIEVRNEEEMQVCSTMNGTSKVHARAKDIRLHGGPGAPGPVLKHGLAEWQMRCGKDHVNKVESYRTLEQCQLQYGPSFATILSWSSTGEHAIAQLSLAEAEAWEHSLQLLHPGIFDGALQLLILVHVAKYGKAQCLLPFCVDECMIATQPGSKGECWATLQITSSSSTSMVGNVEISSDGMLLVRLTGIHMRSSSQVQDGVPDDVDDNVTYDVIWESSTVTSNGENGHDLKHQKVLLCCHEDRAIDVQRIIPWENCRCVDIKEVEEVLRAGSYDVLFYFAEGDALDSLVDALRLMQAAQRALANGSHFTLLLATERTQPPQLDEKTFDPSHAGLWGLARAARLECDFQIHMLDWEKGIEGDHGANLQQLWNEEECCFREKAVFVPRLQRSEIKPAWPLQLHLPRRGSIAAVEVKPQVVSPTSVPSGLAALLRVAAVALNFRDVLNVMGLYPGDPGPPGLDCSGILANETSSLGSLGTAVFGISFGCLRSYATIKEPKLLIERPTSWSHIDAAALPTVFTTVEVALNEVAKLQAGQRLLVHAGAGGVGLTAVQYALHKGALVYATAGREEKKQYLLEMGVKFVSSSRDGGRFEEELGKHLEDEKIDVVLNSLSHDDFIGRSVNFLREGGVFVEIGKRGIWTPEQMKQRRPDIQYKVIAMDTLCDQEPDRFQTLLARLSHRMQTDWSPLPREVYEGLESCADALSVLRRAEKLGKIVVTVPFRMVTDGDGTYVLSGGTGALGLCVSRRLIEEGANDLVLISSRGVLQDLGLQRSAAEVQLWQCDLASKEAADVLTTHVKAYGGPTVKGVFHLAGRLRDGLLATLLRHDVETTYGCKVNGLLAMQQAFSRVDQWQNLDFLLCFSSTASILGAAGQANYAAANASMDAWTYKYRLSSLMASTVQWGAWLEIGMAAANPSTFKHLAQKGISMELGLAMLSAMLRPVSPTSLVCAKVDWIPFLSKFGAGRPKFFGYMSSNQTPLVTTPTRESPLVARSATSLEFVKSVASEVIGDLEVDEPLTTAGMDSLSAVELRRKLAEAASSQGSKKFQLPSTVAFDYPTVRALAEYLDQSVLQQFVEAPVEAAAVRNGAGTAPRTRLVAGEASKLPGAHATDAEAWTIFQQQVDAVTEIPLLRFDVNECFDPTAAGVGFLTYARHASFIDGVDLFDPRFFGISSNEAAAIDPQQRHVLEVAYAACHDAGRSRKELTKKSIGVFVGQCANDWAKTWKERKPSTFMGPGTHASIAANRISFCLGLEGVSLTVDTACSSTLVALDMSIQRLGDMEAVLCSGSQLNLIAEPFVAFCNGRLLSPTGRCKTFDATADGFARGEGFGSFFLVKDTAEGACIAGAMSNQDGRSSSLTAPNGPAQQRAITGALKLAGTSGADIAAVECHGTGTSLGDPIEVGALGGTLCVRENPLLLMAGKTNVGHLEGAAGALGLVKCLASLKNLEVPPNVHLAELNLHLDLKQDLLLVPSSKHSLTNSESISPMIGLSSFGFGGTNAHAILAKQKGERHLAGSLDQLTFKPMSFPWSSPVPRLLSYRNKEMMFEVRLDSELIKHQNNVHHQQVLSSSLLVAFAMEGCLRHLKTSPASVIQLKAFRMIAPLILPSEYDGQIWLRLSINEQQFQVESRHRFSQQAWQVHCMGRFSTQAPRQSVGTMGNLNILGTAGLRRPAGPAGAQRGPMAESFEVLCRSAERVSDESLEEWKKKATEEGWPLRADLLDMLEDLHMKKGEICARVKLPPNFSAYTVHPELLEIFHLAVQCLAFLGESSKSLSQDLSSITSVAVPSQDIPKGTEFLVLHGRERRYGVSPNSVSSSFTLSVDGGVTVLEVQEFQVRPVTQRQVLSAMNSSVCSATSAPSLYEMQWSPGASGRTLQEEGGNWLLLCPGDADLAAGLSEVIEKEKVSQVGKDNSDSESDKESETKMEEDLSPKEEPSEASSESPRSRSKDGQPLTTCKDALPDEELDTFLESFDKIFVIASGTGSSRAIDVLAAALLVLKAKDSKTEIWFVVEGTQAAQLEDLGKASLPYHAGLWGLARCARREQRSSFVGCLEVGCSSGPSSASGIWRRVRSACASQEDGREDELLVRRAAFDTQDSDSDDDDVERHFARLEETTTKAVGIWPPPVFASHSWFVISGGFGGLGLAMASWLVTQGVTHLALLSRSGKCQDEQAANKLQQLCSDEIKVLTEACDISSQDAVQKAASIMAMDELPVKGVIHAAGLLEDHLIAHMDGSRHLLPVLAPKMDGAVNLHAIFGAMRLDHFMLFSSVAALLGSPGQGNYAAANSFLDSFALHRQARGLTALSLQWGPWAEVGMAAMRGVGGPGFWAPKITAMDALQALGSVLTSRSPAVISITQVNWSILLKRMSALPPTWSNFKNYWEPVEPKETKLETEFDDRKRFGIGGRPDHGPSLAKFRGLGPPGSMAMGLTGLTLGLGPMSLVSGRGGPRMTNEAKEMPKEAKVVSTGSRESSSSESPSEPGSPDITAGRQGL